MKIFASQLARSYRLTTTLVVAAWSTFGFAAQTTSSEQLYKSLAQAVDTAQGNCYLEFNAGKYKSTVPGNGLVEWTIPEGCVGSIQFNYALGSLQSLLVKFDPPIEMRLLTSQSCLRVSGAHYNKLGGILQFDARPCHGTPVPTNDQRSIKEHLRVGTRTENLLLGSLLDRQVSITPVAGSDNGSTPPANPVRLVDFRSEPQTPALKITLKDESQLDFAQKSAGKPINTITVKAPTFLDLDYAKYNVESGYAYGSIRKLHIETKSGQFSCGSAILTLGEGTAFDGAHIYFDSNYQNSGSALVSCEGGLLSANLDGGHFQLEGARTNASHLTFGPGSKIEVDDFRLMVQDGGQTVINFGGATKGTLNILDGLVPLSTAGYTKLSAPSTITFGDLSGKWESGGSVRVVGRINHLSLNSTDTVLRPNADSKLSFTSFIAKGSNLSLSSSDTPLLTGDLSQVDATLGRSSLVVPASIQLQLASGKVHARTFRLHSGKPCPSTELELQNISIEEFNSSQLKSLSMSGGELSGAISLTESGDISTPYQMVGGQPNFETTDLMTYTGGTATYTITRTARADFAVGVSKGTLWPAVVGAQRKFTAEIAGTVKSFSTVFTSEHRGYSLAGGSHHVPWDLDNDGEDNEDARLYPVSGSVSLSSAVPFGPVPLAIDGSAVDFSFETDFDLALRINPGVGEYANENNHEVGGTGQFTGYQEVFRDLIGTSTIHLYVNQGTYPLKVKMALKSDSAGFKTDVKSVAVATPLTRPTAWERDGGGFWLKLAQIGTMFVKVISIGIFDYTGDVSDDRIDGMITAMIGTQIQNIGRRWGR